MSEIASQLREVAGITTGLLYSRRKLLNDAADEIETLNAKLETANALVTCCCGSPVDTHGMGDGHSAVDMYHYHLMRTDRAMEANRQVIETLRTALTPSAETKAAYMGEFSFPKTYTDEYGDEITVNMSVPWTTIKEIMKAISARVAALSDKGAVS